MKKRLMVLSYLAIYLISLLSLIFTNATDNLFQAASLAVSAALPLIAIATIHRVLRYFQQETYLNNKIAVALILVFSALLVFFVWPGAIGIDDIFLVESLKMHQASGFHSSSYSIISNAFRVLTGNDFHISLLNWCLYCHLIISVYSMTAWKEYGPLYVFLGAIFMAPHTIGLVIFQNRDATYSLLLLVFLFGLLEYRKGRFQTTLFPIWLIFSMGVLLGEMRQEGKFITLLTPFVVAYYLSVGRRKLLVYSASVFLAAISIQVVFPRLLQADSYSPVYQSTALINPLSHIVHTIGEDQLTAEQKSVIGQFMNYQIFIETNNPYDIEAFHKGAVFHPIKTENYMKFRDLTFELIAEHPSVYLHHRWMIFLRLFNLEKVGYYLSDEMRFPSAQTLELVKKSELKGYPLVPSWAQSTFYWWFNVIFSGLPQPWHLILASTLIPLIGLVYFTATIRRNPELGIISGLLLMRVIMMTFLVPSSYYKYIASTWPAGWLLILFYVLAKKRPS